MDFPLIKKNYLAHAAIWLSYLILLIWFNVETRPFGSTMLKSIFIVIVQAAVFYLNFFFLLPRFFEQKKYALYLFWVSLILVASIILFFLFDQLSLRWEYQQAIRDNDWSRLPGGFRRRHRHGGPPHWNNLFEFHFIWRQVLFHAFFVVIVLFISTIYRNVKISSAKEREAIELKSRVTEAESTMLKSQINPHFLFNTLNNIYSMAQLKSDKAPLAIHRLSEMLRYVIYDCSHEYVKLGQEIRYLKSYIELNLMKEEGLDNVRYDFSNVNENLLIAPMILIPFVENSFKHGHIEDTENSWIDISMSTRKNQLIFEVLNTVPGGSTKKDKSSGVGLENVKQRLKLIYHGKYSFKIQQRENIFEVQLKIELHDS